MRDLEICSTCDGADIRISWLDDQDYIVFHYSSFQDEKVTAKITIKELYEQLRGTE